MMQTERIESMVYKDWPVLEVNVTNHLERYAKEVKIDSTQNDGSQSWIVISRGVDKYETEHPEENEKPIHYKK